jgi:hypothetical protein
MCRIKGCKAKPVAKRLCAKHYMRFRRTGDANQTRKAGRKRSEYLSHWRKHFPEYSPRTVARLVEAMRLLPSGTKGKRLIKAATRPNGSLNVKKLLRMATVQYITRHFAGATA